LAKSLGVAAGKATRSFQPVRRNSYYTDLDSSDEAIIHLRGASYPTAGMCEILVK
jgi:hypothetical protein